MKKNRQATKGYALKVTKRGPTINIHGTDSIHDTIEQAAEALKEVTADFGRGYWIWKVDGEDIAELSETEQAIANAAWKDGEQMKYQSRIVVKDKSVAEKFNQALEDRLLDRAAVAKRWGCSVQTIKRLEGEVLKLIRIGGRVRFRLSDILCSEREGELCP
jgi:hypothetical protein